MFMTSQALKISQSEFDALIKVRNGLKNGRFVHANSRDLDEIQKEKISKPIFDMNISSRVMDCGTAGCIGGWVYTAMTSGKISTVSMRANTNEADGYVSSDTSAELTGHSKSLFDLYYPKGVADWDLIKPSIAARAIENFLTFGDPMWNSLVGE